MLNYEGDFAVDSKNRPNEFPISLSFLTQRYFFLDRKKVSFLDPRGIGFFKRKSLLILPFSLRLLNLAKVVVLM